MRDFYIAEADAADFFDASNTAVLVEGAIKLPGHWQDGYVHFEVHWDDDGDLRIQRAGRKNIETWRKFAFPGSNVVAAIVKPSSQIAKAFNDKAVLTQITVIEAESVVDALHGLANVIVSEMRQMSRALALAYAALAAARNDAETTHVAMAATLRTLGDAKPQRPQVIRACIPDPQGPTIELSAGASQLRQLLSIPLDGLTALSMHVAECAGSPASFVHVRLRSAATEVIHGSWLVTLDKLAIGWRTLDLRSVIGPLFETALLQIETMLATDERLALSLDPAECEDFAALSGHSDLPPRHGLCLRLFRSPFGSRNVLPQFWNWDEIGAGAREVAVRQRLSSDIWERVHVLEGEVELVSIGMEVGQPVIFLRPEKPAALRIADVELRNGNVLEFEFTSVPTSNAPARVRIVVEELSAPENSGRLWSSDWKTIAPGFERAAIALRVHPFPKLANVLASFEIEGGEGSATIEWSSIATLRAPEFDFASSRATTEGNWSQSARFHARNSPGRAAPRTAPLFSALQVDHAWTIPEAKYEHIDVKVFDLHVSTDFVPAVRFKFVRSQEELHLEFRERPDWPAVFQHWPGQEQDQYGPYFHLRASPTSPDGFRDRMSEQDVALVDALLAALPLILSATLSDPNVSNRNSEAWNTSLRSFLAACQNGSATRCLGSSQTSELE